MGGHPTRKRQRVGELIEHLRLLTPPVSGCIAGAQLPLLRTAPTRRGGGGGKRQGKHTCRKTHLQETAVSDVRSGTAKHSVNHRCQTILFSFRSSSVPPCWNRSGGGQPTSALIPQCLFSVLQSGIRNVPNQREQNVIYAGCWETSQILLPIPVISLLVPQSDPL